MYDPLQIFKMEELAQAFLQSELRVKIKKDKDNAAKPPG